MRNPEVDFAAFARLLFEPFPSFGQRFAVNRIGNALLGLSLIGANENDRSTIHATPHAVQAAKALSERIKAGAFGDEAIKIQVCPHFQGLSCNDDDWFFQMASR